MAKRRKRPRRINWPLVSAWTVLLIALPTIYFVSVVCSVHRRADPISMQMEIETALLNRAFDFFVGFWFFVLGCCIGSFLNVVVCRLPAGLSLLGSSRCPFCYVPIESRDNIPVFGWLGLRGRCRACRLPISRRYPIVEALCGAAFLVIYLFVIWFPTRIGTMPTPISDTVRSPFLYAYLRGGLLMFFVAWLIALALVRMDRATIPLAISGFGVFAAIMSLVLPGCLDLFHSVRHEELYYPEGMIKEGIFKCYGIAVGLALGILMHGVNRRNSGQSFVGSSLAGISVGACLGWPVTVIVFAFGIVAVIGSRDDASLFRRCLNPWTVICTLTLLLYMVGAWIHLHERFIPKISSWIGY